MKIWNGYGSEHSMNLVMIGRFKNVGDAEKAKQIIDSLAESVSADVEAGVMEVGNPPQRFSERMLELLRKVNIYIIAANEFEQFAYDFRLAVDGEKVILTTEESDVSAFLKVLVHQGARVEVYSAHDYPDAEYGRGK
jgi:Family of unknown function (DUF6375)